MLKSHPMQLVRGAERTDSAACQREQSGVTWSPQELEMHGTSPCVAAGVQPPRHFDFDAVKWILVSGLYGC